MRWLLITHARDRGTRAEVFDDLLEIARLDHGSTAVEVGCGTGQATVPLAERGLEVTAVELGATLAENTRGRVTRFPRVSVVNASFEEWEPPRNDFDAVISFAAFHWIDPSIRYVKSAEMLKRSGSLVVFDWDDALPTGESAQFFTDVLEDYDAVVPEWRMQPPVAPSGTSASTEQARMEASNLFGSVTTRRYVWDAAYSPDDYVAFPKYPVELPAA